MNKANIALFLGISPQNYGRYEAGRIPDAVTLSVIADRCGVTVDWLLGRDPSALPSASSAPPREPAQKPSSSNFGTPLSRSAEKGRENSGHPCPEFPKRVAHPAASPPLIQSCPSRSREAPAPYAADPRIPAIEDRLATIEQLLLRLLAATSPSPTQENTP